MSNEYDRAPWLGVGLVVLVLFFVLAVMWFLL